MAWLTIFNLPIFCENALKGIFQILFKKNIFWMWNLQILWEKNEGNLLKFSRDYLKYLKITLRTFIAKNSYNRVNNILPQAFLSVVPQSYIISIKEIFLELGVGEGWGRWVVVWGTMLGRHDQNPSKSKSLSHLKIFYSRLRPVISRLLIVNSMLPTR
jgi:hypothetical protein